MEKPQKITDKCLIHAGRILVLSSHFYDGNSVEMIFLLKNCCKYPTSFITK